MSDKYWREVTPSRFPHERTALAYLRDRLPDHEPWRVWTNFEFMADDGSINEVDALVHSPAGFFLVEIKGNPGAVTGDQGTLTFVQEGRRKSINHPRRLTGLKAKRLISVLKRSPSVLRSQRLALPRLEELVFLSHATQNDLEMPPAGHVTFTSEVDPNADVIAALSDRQAPGLRPNHSDRGNKELAKLISTALDEVKIVRRRSKLRIGDYECTKRLDEGAAYADFLGHNIGNPKVELRLRRYSAARSATLEREQVYNATSREHSLLSRLSHPGILAVRGYTSDEYGPAIVFEHDPAAQRLDRYLAEHGDSLDVDARLDLVRKIAEPLQFAHERSIVHRCLSPQSILVIPTSDATVAQVKLMNWSTGSLDAASTSVGSTLLAGTLHPEAFQDGESTVFLAPELRRKPESVAATLDVFSLGAVAYQVFAGTAPAASPDDLYDKIREHGLELSAAIDATPEALSRLIEKSTRAQVSDRYESIAAFLLDLDVVAEDIARPATEVTDPREAGPGDTLPDGTRIVNRLGSGATAIAFRVERGEDDSAEQFVLKVAREIDKNELIQKEITALRELDHPRITRLIEVMEVGGFHGFLSKPASTETLRSRLRRDGAFQPELLQRFGEQLIDALAYMESRGINHRDIKPDNIAISDGDKKAALGLVLFDFSLSGQPLDQIEVGTPQYSDPFLGDRRPKRWDLQAERYSAAVTLYEMATSVLPKWGDGESDPRLTKDELQLDADRFPAGLRLGLQEFFLAALARDPAGRFDNAERMRVEWAKAFQPVATNNSAAPTAAHLVDDASEGFGPFVAALGEKTPLADLPFSTRVRTALDRLDLFTVEAFLATPPNNVLRQRGVGEKTRQEIQAAMRSLRELFPGVTIGKSPAEETTSPARPSVAATTAATTVPKSDLDEVDPPTDDELPRDLDGLLRRIRRGSGRQPKRRQEIIDAVLGWSDDAPSALSFPNQSRAAERLSLNPGTISAELSQLREIWASDLAYTALRHDLALIMERNGGVMAPSELAEALFVERGSHLPRKEALHVAAAVARAATEAEAASQDEEPRWMIRRRDHRTWLAATEDHAQYAGQIADRGMALAQSDPLPGREAVEAALLGVTRPDEVGALPGTRLARLVAAADDGIDLSARGELYPVPLEPKRAILLSLGALVGAGRRHPKARRDPSFEGVRVVEVEEIHDRVRSRYPESAELPDRPELDHILTEAGWTGRWSDEVEAYELRMGDAHSVTSGKRSSYRTAPAQPGASLSPEVAEAREFEDRLRMTLQHRRFLVVKAPVQGIRRAATLIKSIDPGLTMVDLDALLIDAIDAHLADRKVDPTLFYNTEALGPGDPSGWSRIQRIVKDAIVLVKQRLSAEAGPICIRNIGLLARYDLWDPLETLNGLAGGTGGRACFVLFPGAIESPSFALFGKSIPALPTQTVTAPRSWLESQQVNAAS